MTVEVVARPHPVRPDIVMSEAPDGCTIAEIVGGVHEDVEVFLGDLSGHIDRDAWHVVKPKPGTRVFVTKVPQDDALGIIGAVVITVAAVALGQVYGPALAASLGYSASGTAAAIATASITAAVSLVGSFALNALIPGQTPSPESGGDRFDRLASITGQSNQMNPFGVIPRLYGTHLIYPVIPMTARPYTEIGGQTQYMRWRGVLGYGPLDLGGVQVGDGQTVDETTTFPDGNPIKIGETSIDEYEEVEYRIGEVDDIAEPLYTDRVFETGVSFTADDTVPEGETGTYQDDISTVRTSEPDATELSIDLVYQGGLFSVGNDGVVAARVRWRIEYAPTGSTNWTQVTEFEHVEERNETFFYTRRWTVPKGQYDVRLTRIETEVSGHQSHQTAGTWTVLRTFRDRQAFNVPGVVVMDIRIKATDQLSGTLDRVNMIATSMLPTWDGSQWTAPVATNTPAWIYADLWTGTAVDRPIPKSQLDTDALAEWATWTESKGITYNRVLDSAGTVLDRAREVAATGRAAWALHDNIISVVRDFEDPTPQVTVTPRVAWGFTERFTFPDVPHAVRVTFTDPDTWEQTERVVFDDGYDDTTATKYDVLETKGVTSADQAWKEGRYHLAQMRLRPYQQEFSQDIVHLLYRRGDTLELQYDVIGVGLGAGRITAVTTDGNGDATAFQTDEILEMEAGGTYAVKVQVIDADTDEPVLRTATIQTDTGGVQSVTLNTPLADVAVGDHFLFGTAGVESAEVKVQKIEPQGSLQAKVTVVAAAPAIHDADTGTIPAWDAQIDGPVDRAKLVPPVPDVQTVRSDETVMNRETSGEPKIRMQVGYSMPSSTVELRAIEMRFRKTDALTWTRVSTDPGDGYIATADVNTGYEYEIQLRARSVYDRVSAWSSVITHTIVGDSETPEPISGLYSEKVANGAAIFWQQPSDPRWVYNEIYVQRLTNLDRTNVPFSEVVGYGPYAVTKANAYTLLYENLKRSEAMQEFLAGTDPELSDSAYVTRLYEVWLQRQPGSEGLNFYVNELASKSRPQIETEFLEGATGELADIDFVLRLYTVFLDRTPAATDAGPQFWLNQLGLPLKNRGTIKQEFLNTATTAEPLTDAEFVDELYETYLERTPSSFEADEWTFRIGKTGQSFAVWVRPVASNGQAGAATGPLTIGTRQVSFTDLDPVVAEQAGLRTPQQISSLAATPLPNGMRVSWQNPNEPPRFVEIWYAQGTSFADVLTDDCSSTSGWTVPNGWSHDGTNDKFVHTPGRNLPLERAISGLTSGEAYELEVELVDGTEGSLDLVIEGGSAKQVGNGIYSVLFTASATSATATFTPDPDYDGAVAAIAVREIPSVTPSETKAGDTIEIAGLSGGQTYSVWARPVNGPTRRGELRGPVTVTAGSSGGTVLDDTTAPNTPTNLAVTSSFRNNFITWDDPSDSDLNGVEIWAASSNDRSQATLVGKAQAGPDTPAAFIHSGLSTNTTRYYWIRAFDFAGNRSDWHPSSSTGGVSATTANLDAVDFENLTIGSAVAFQLAADNLLANSALLGSITISGTNDDLNTVQANASDGAVFATNVSGSDFTVIDGGTIETDSIFTSSLQTDANGRVDFNGDVRIGSDVLLLGNGGVQTTDLDAAGNIDADTYSLSDSTFVDSVGRVYGESFFADVNVDAQADVLADDDVDAGNDLLCGIGNGIDGGSDFLELDFNAAAQAAGGDLVLNPGQGFGETRADGDLAATGSKPFHIRHPVHPGKTLRHFAMEGPEILNFYRFEVVAETADDEIAVPLPDYWPHINRNVEICVFQKDGFGTGYGSWDGDRGLSITCSQPGVYTVWVTAERCDSNICNREVVQDARSAKPKSPRGFH